MEAERPVGRRLWLIRGEMIVAWTKLVMVRSTGFWVYFGIGVESHFIDGASVAR